VIKMANGSTFGKPSSNQTDIGVVMEVLGGVVRVKPQASKVCDTCGSQSVCFPSHGEAPLVDVINEVNAQVGDVVTLEQGEGPKIGASLLVFGLPVATTIGGTLLGMHSASDPTGGAASGAIAGLALGMLTIHFISRIVGRTGGMRPVARKVVGHREITVHAEPIG